MAGAALAVAGSAVYTLYFVLLYSLYLRIDPSWTSGEAWSRSESSASILALIIAVPALIALRVVPLLFIGNRIGVMYERLTYRRANNTAASWIGLVLAGSGTGAMIIVFSLFASHYGLLPPSQAKGVMSIFGPVVLILIWLMMVLIAWEPYRRRHCPRCGGLLTRMRAISLSTATAEQVAAIAQDVAPPTWPSLSEDNPDEDPDNVGCALLAYRCDSCPARLLEGNIAVERPEQKDNWAIWVWLSAVYSSGETAALEAKFPRLSLWDRLLLRH